MPADGALPGTLHDEARRQVEICNACRYCEGYCAVFPAIARERAFADGDLTQLANLCHNCRGCYYACQYTEPHEFALNLPAILADVRADSWERLARPRALARLMQRHGVALAAATVLAVAVMILAIRALPGGGAGFYAHLSHGAMVAIFVPAFLAPLAAIGWSLRAYWRETGGGRLSGAALADALRAAGTMRNLSGGQGQGCNFEVEERPSRARRTAHQMTLWGFLLCFAATSAGTVMHYGLGWEAPYGPRSAPKLLGVPGGLLLTAGALWLAGLRLRADPALGAAGRGSGEMAFVLLLALTGASGLALYAATGTALVPALLALHLGAVLTLFLSLPYSKMAHGFYRLAALARDANDRAG